jgi:hypothetical protein
MIIYNVGRQWFALKDAADKYRVSQGLLPASLATVSIEGRLDACNLLNALCGASPASLEPFTPAGNRGSRPMPKVYEDVEVPDFIPAFLLKDGKRRV